LVVMASTRPRVFRAAGDERRFHVAGDLLELLGELPAELVGHRVRAAHERGSARVLVGRRLLGVGNRHLLLVDLEDVRPVGPHATLSGGGVRTLNALPVIRGVPQIVGAPGEHHRVDGHTAGQAADGGQERGVLRGNAEQLPDVVGQVVGCAQTRDSGHLSFLSRKMF